jgi:hypothetical protein
MFRDESDEWKHMAKMPTLAEKRRLVCATVRSLLREKGFDLHTVSISDVNRVFDDYMRGNEKTNVFLLDYWCNAPMTVSEEKLFAKAWRDELRKQTYT